MTIWKDKPRRKPSGGRYHKQSKRKRGGLGRDAGSAVMSDLEERQKIRTRGGHQLVALVKAAYANVSDGRTVKRTKIKDVAENPANRHFVRRDVVTKGAILKTEAGLARVTSRPTRSGVVNAVLIKESGKK